MEVLKAKSIERFDNFTTMIYSQPGVGKTSMVKTLKGNTIVFSVDGMYHVLSGFENVSIARMDSKKPNDELADFYRYILKYIDNIDNIVIDNLSTFQRYWLNATAKGTKNGTPEMRDYQIIDRILLDFITSLKDLNKNLVIFTHETSVEVTRESGGVYTQFQPDVRGLDSIMGVVPLVGRLLVVRNTESNEDERLVILQPTRTTRAKDQLIGDIQTIKQMELFPLLQADIKGEE